MKVNTFCAVDFDSDCKDQIYTETYEEAAEIAAKSKNAENGCGWTEFFDSEEYEHNENFEPSCEQISELKNWISENYK